MLYPLTSPLTYMYIRESEPSQLALLCCLALFGVSPFNHALPFWDTCSPHKPQMQLLVFHVHPHVHVHVQSYIIHVEGVHEERLGNIFREL